MKLFSTLFLALACTCTMSAQFNQWNYNRVNAASNTSLAQDGTIVVNFENAAVIQDYSGEYMINAQNNDWYLTLDVYADKLEGTHVTSDFDSDYTSLINWNTYDFIYPTTINCVVTVENGMYIFNVNMEADGQNYEVHLWAPAPPEGALEFDTQIGDVNTEYAPEEMTIVDRHDMGENDIVIVLEAADGTSGTVLRLMLDADKVDAQHVIPEGVYPIDATGASATVTASVGVVNNTVMPSYYATLRGGKVSKPYFLTSGTVEVQHTSNGIALYVDAKNSWNVPVKIQCVPELTGINDINVAASKTRKAVENGQVVIIKGDRKYNVTGAQMK